MVGKDRKEMIQRELMVLELHKDEFSKDRVIELMILLIMADIMNNLAMYIESK